MRLFFLASLMGTALLLAPVVGMAASAPHPVASAAGLAQPVGWWEQQPQPNEPRQRYDRLPPYLRDYYNTLEYRIGLLDSWRGGDLKRRSPTQYRLMSDLIDQMRREQYSILKLRYPR
ncbi:MAG TPA: hypothetical protein VMG55_08895 [Stellaceae bacterium]|nr:hypothetical protein [Stellaceae bacterium]